MFSRIRLFKSCFRIFTFRLVSLSTNFSSGSIRREGVLKMTTIDSPQFRNIFTPEMLKLKSIFECYNFPIRIAGGAVRDLLMGFDPVDIDFATEATPDEMLQMFRQEGVRTLNDNGLSHGTVTARINDTANFEITTLRIDVLTDGRRAKVEFTKDWQLDANRRDLTMNSMFLDFNGILYDYFNGREDIERRRVVFVGSAVDRICEDYLRILRYFRFFGRVSENGLKHEPAVLEAIRKTVGGLANISGERIYMELSKIVAGRFAPEILRVMQDCGLNTFIGFPESLNHNNFKLVYDRTNGESPAFATLMAAALSKDSEFMTLNERLHMSKRQRELGLFLLHHREDDWTLKDCQNCLVDAPGGQVKATRFQVGELLKYCGKWDVLEKFEQWELARFPVSGTELLPLKLPKGPIFRNTLTELREIWKQSNFKMGKDELLTHVDRVVERLKNSSK